MADLGTKYECPECSAKFYDLGTPGRPCPKCGWSPNGGDEAAAEDDDKKKKKKK